MSCTTWAVQENKKSGRRPTRSLSVASSGDAMDEPSAPTAQPVELLIDAWRSDSPRTSTK